MKILLSLILVLTTSISSFAADPVDTTPSGAKTEKLTKASFKEEWPFTVDSGTVACSKTDDGRNLVTFSVGEKTYALNGTAKSYSQQLGWSDINEIWKADPEIPGVKISIGPVIKAGLSLGEN